MSATVTVKAVLAKSKKERNKDKPPPVSERLKTVVRRLPPNLPEDIFWGSVATWVTDETVTWKAYYGGKLRKRLNKENIPSRAYIAFKNEESLSQFSKEYDGHLFRDKAGNEYQAVVEFAPYQKIPSEKKKADARNATIEKDEDYISFIESLKPPTNPELVSIESLIAASQPPAPPKTTPLLEALKAEKTAHKDKEAILRNHAHYKDATILAPPRKEEPKKKGAPAPKPVEFTPSSNKKASKKQAPAVSVPPAAQKPPPATATPTKTPTAAPVPSNVVPKTPKPPRPPKPPAHVKQPQGGPKPAPPAPTIATLAAAPVALPTGGPAPPTQGEAAHAAPPPVRRARPVIGLASRQFEAALSGAGVGAAAPGDRKSRRDRERERGQREKEAEAGSSAAGAPAPAAAKPAPPSPRRARHHKEAAAASSPPAKVPGILQPTSTPAAAAALSRVEVSNGTPQQGGVPPNQITGGGGGGGRGGRRGRGRGRGGDIQGAPVRGG